MPGLVATLRAAGVTVVNALEDGVVGPTGAPCEAVVVGLCRTFTYALLSGAMAAIAGGARFVATNPDAKIPLADGRDAPGAGALVAAVRTCTGVEPTVVGKPKPFLIETILREAGLRPEEALVVGDREDNRPRRRSRRRLPHLPRPHRRRPHDPPGPSRRGECGGRARR